MQCAVCLEEDIPEADAAVLPCCNVPQTSSTRFCRRCIQIICEQGTAGVGRCPNCRGYIRVGEDGTLQVAERVGTCSMCRQARTIVEDRGMVVLCDACVLGTQYTLRYECERCLRMQRIPHPMWRYQRTPGEFGTATWACHQRCGTFTHWRIAPQDAGLVPAEDAPESWGRREEWLAAVRAQRQRERAVPSASPASRRTRVREALIIFIALGLLGATRFDGIARILLLLATAVTTWFFRAHF